MRKRMKRAKQLATMILAGVMTCSNVMMSRTDSVHEVWAEETADGFVIENGTLKAYNGTETAVVIPDEVYSIDSNAFRGNTDIVSVVIPNSISWIQQDTFANCSKLSQVTLPEGLWTLGGNAFGNCDSLRSIYIPAWLGNVTGDKGPFEGCDNLETITFEDGKTSIPQMLFKECTGLKKIDIPDSVTAIGNSAFEGCTNLSDITIPSGVSEINQNAFKGTKWLENRQKENPLVVVNNILIDGTTCSGDITLPDGINAIAQYAFYDNDQLTSVVFPEDWSGIGASYAFANCDNLASITVKDNIGYIEYTVFDGCSALTTVKGYTGSYASKYASDKGYTFEAIEMPDNYIIKNDETGIPDVKFYEEMLDEADYNEDGILTKGEALGITYLY